MLEEVALSRTFGEEAGQFFHDVLVEHGVELLGGEELEAFEGDGRVKAVRDRRAGATVEGDMVVVGAGVRPDVMLAERAGLEVDDGIVCDSKLETLGRRGSSPPATCCSYDSVVHGRRLRVEHWDVALQQGRHAAQGDARLRRALPRGPVLLQRPRRLGVARVRRPGERLGRGRLARRPRRAASSASGTSRTAKVKGALAVGRSEDLVHARTLIETGRGRLGRRRTRWRDAIRSSESIGAVALALSRRYRFGAAFVGDWCNWQHASFWYQ